MVHVYSQPIRQIKYTIPSSSGLTCVFILVEIQEISAVSRNIESLPLAHSITSYPEDKYHHKSSWIIQGVSLPGQDYNFNPAGH